MKTAEWFTTGKAITTADTRVIEELPWNDHPSFEGVALKHLMTGADTDGKFSLHLVRVKVGFSIGEHLHEGKWEIHEVIAGEGTGILNGRRIHYHAGANVAVPADMLHEVHAESEEILIAATFIPALI